MLFDLFKNVIMSHDAIISRYQMFSNVLYTYRLEFKSSKVRVKEKRETDYIVASLL